MYDLPDYLIAYDRNKWNSVIDEMKAYIKAEASPGVPHAIISNRNDELMDKMGERLNEIILNRIERLLSMSILQVKSMTRMERIDSNLVDPVRVFVKNEPHKVEKLLEGRPRLIMSVSLTDKIIEMLISRFVCKEDINNWRSIPSKPGIGFDRDDSLNVYNDIANCGLPMASSDVSGWDWGVKQWQIIDEAESIIKLTPKHSADWNHLLRVKAVLESESVYQFSDGTMVQPLYKGVVNSGKLRTSRGNSWMRVRLADLVGSRKTIAAGDDCVESIVPNATEKYRDYGIRLKGYDTVNDSFEFCSHIYSSDGAYPVNKEKMVMNLLHQKPRDFLEWRATMLAFDNEMASHPEYCDVLKQIESVGYHEVEGPHYI